jgi:hypothetical protein
VHLTFPLNSGAAPPTKNSVQLAQSVPDLSTLVTAVVAGNPTGPLSGPGPFTVFAPTNEAKALPCFSPPPLYLPRTSLPAMPSLSVMSSLPLSILPTTAPPPPPLKAPLDLCAYIHTHAHRSPISSVSFVTWSGLCALPLCPSRPVPPFRSLLSPWFSASALSFTHASQSAPPAQAEFTELIAGQQQRVVADQLVPFVVDKPLEFLDADLLCGIFYYFNVPSPLLI